MMNENQEPQVLLHSNNIFGVLVGMLVGALGLVQK